jgi:asparagine synthase (glutamine-hydrolysing)
VDTGGGTWGGFEDALAEMALARSTMAAPAAFAPWLEAFSRPLLEQGFLASFEDRRDRDLWFEYVATKHRDLQMYNCWHEDRTAAASSIENRVPLLDHHLVEHVVSVPASARARLLWDKQILRRAAERSLPREVTRRRKTPFFYGVDARFAHRMLVRILQADGGALVEEALDAPGVRDVVSADAVVETLADVAADPGHNGIELLLRVVNLGLLQTLAQRPPVTPPVVTAPAQPVLAIGDWDADADAVATAVAADATVSPRAVVRLAPNVLVLADARGDDDSWFVAVDGEIRFALEPTPWRSFLAAVDGETTVEDVCEVAGVSPAAVAASLAEALEAGLLLADAPVRADVS